MNFENDDGTKVKKNSEEDVHFFESVRLVEALLFASAKPLDRAALQSRIPDNIAIDFVLENIEKVFSTRGVNLFSIGGSVAFRTASDLAENLRMTVSVKRKLSSAAVETMAIIAYHQPVTRGDIEAIRGVTVSKGTLDTLLEAGWIRPMGRRKIPGRPLQWGTSSGFLDHFGIENLQDLPGLEELKAAGLLEKRQSLTSLILPDDLLDDNEEDLDEEQNELFGPDDDEV